MQKNILLKTIMSNQESILIIIAVFFASFISGCYESKNVTIPYRQETHGGFDEEWAPHNDVGGWWYATGMLHDINNPDHLYAYQYTVFHFSPSFGPELKQGDLSMFDPKVATLMKNFTMSRSTFMNGLTLIDLQTGQRIFKFEPGVEWANTYANHNAVAFNTPHRSLLNLNEDNMTLSAGIPGVQLELTLDKGKGASWHADDGVLVMGCENASKARSVYYSYTNMPTTGSLNYYNKAGENVTLQIAGKTWFDRQWGPIGLNNGGMFWEWFSLRFFDDEEVMLFAFPQNGYQDGTYVDADGNTQIFNHYTYTPEELWEGHLGHTFSWGWDLTMPGIKEEHYRIVPMVDKLGIDEGLWVELPAEIVNDNDEVVGHAFVELIPGARNDMPDPCLN